MIKQKKHFIYYNCKNLNSLTVNVKNAVNNLVFLELKNNLTKNKLKNYLKFIYLFKIKKINTLNKAKSKKVRITFQN
jgi:ribosomal protein L23